MIMDNELLFADSLAYGGTPEVLDLSTVNPGRGEPITIFVQGSSDLAGVTGLTLTDGATSAAADACAVFTGNPAGTILFFTLPFDIKRYAKLALAGSPSAGSWSAGVVLKTTQTNK